MKRIHIACLMLVLLAAVFCLAGGAQAAGSATVVASGDCGAEAGQLAWTLYSDGEMVITASGSSASSYVYMQDMSGDGGRLVFRPQPWKSLIPDIRTLRFEGTGQIRIGDGAFKNCTSLTSVDLDGVYLVGYSVFENCSALTTVTFPETSIDLDGEAFRNCGNLKNMTNANKIHMFGDHCFKNCVSLEGMEFDSTGQITIGTGAFMGCTALTSVNLQGVYEVGSSAFEGCSSLKTVTFDDDIKIIYRETFSGCSALETVRLSQSLTGIYHCAFKDCLALETIAFPASFRTIDEYAFSGCTGLTSITFNGAPPARVDESNIYGKPFDDCQATVHYPNIPAWQVRLENDPGAYYGSNLTWSPMTATIADVQGTLNTLNWQFSYQTGILEITGIGDMEFRVHDYRDPNGGYDPPVAGQESYEIPWSKYKTGITRVIIGNGVTTIGNSAFSGCESLKTVDYPDSLTSVGKKAFSGCSNLVNAYLPNGILVVPEDVYKGCSSLRSIEIPDGVLRIDQGAFKKCSSLESVVIPDSVKEIYGWAFEQSGLKTVTLGRNLELIDGYAFRDIPMESIFIPRSVKTIWSNAFNTVSEVTFEGDVPNTAPGSLFHNALSVYYGSSDPDHQVTVHYPGDNSTWDDVVAVDQTDWEDRIIWEPIGSAQTVDIYRCSFALDEKGFVYDGTEKTPGVTGYYGETPLTAGTHYTLSYSDNVNAGSGTVTITGKGRYQGEVILSFEIARAEPSLSFASNSVTKEVGEGAFTNALTKTTDGTVTYTSSDPAVATVASGTGRVTVVGEGTAIITANAAQGRNYAAGSASFTLVVYTPVQALAWEDFRYNFVNTYSTFNYARTYKIPLARYEYIYTPIVSEMLYSKAGAWGGSCYGFSSSSVLMNGGTTDLNVAGFGKTRISDLAVSTKNSRLNISVQQLLESMQVSFKAFQTRTYHAWNFGNIGSMCRDVENAATTHKYPVVCVYHSDRTGHALVGIRVEHKSTQYDYLYVYDCNHPTDSNRYVVLYKNARGQYTGSWKYDGGYGTAYSSEAGGMISYVPYAAIETVWKNKGKNETDSGNLLIISNASFAIYDYADNLLGSADHGRFTSYRKGIFEVLGVDEDNNGSTMISLPTSVYRIVNGEEGVLKVGMVNQNQSAEVETTAPSVIVTVSDEDLINQVEVEGFEGDQYCVTLNSALPGDEDISEVQFSGRSSGVNLTVGVCGHDFILNNCPGVSLLVKGQMMAIPGDTDRKNVASYNFALEYTACVYDGTAKMPGVKTLDDYNLKQNVDYVVSYENNTQVGTAKATVWGVGAYMGSVVLNFDIVATEVDLCPNDHMWDEGVITQAPTLLRDGNITYTCSVCGTKKVENFPGLYYYQVSRTGSAVTVSLTNNTNDKVTALFCLAAYDVTGRMTDLRIQSLDLASGGTTQYKLNFNSGSPAKVKAFLLDEARKMPISEAWIG